MTKKKKHIKFKIESSNGTLTDRSMFKSLFGHPITETDKNELLNKYSDQIHRAFIGGLASNERAKFYYSTNPELYRQRIINTN